MPIKTDRILSYLPGTFRRSPRRSALFALVDAFGAELLQAENSLAAIMQAHWVDHADRGADIIDDLARIAALYGLAPRCRETDSGLCSLPPGCEETVEEFREHLKRYVRTFLEGTVTVQGILRVTAEALGLHIADDYQAMDTWWDRADDSLLTVHPRGDDVANLLLGLEAVTATGSAARPAQVKGTIDLSGGVDLGEAAVLRLKVDDQAPVDIDLINGVADPSDISLSWLEVRINVTLGQTVAGHDNHFLTLTSPTSGAASRLEVQPLANDAAEQVLGLAAQQYRGSEARAARVSGTVDLSAGVDLSAERYLRLAIDGTILAEIDCAGPTPANTTLDQLQAAINNALGSDIAGHDGQYLTLTSPTTSFNSSIAFQPPAAQDAKTRLFGVIEMFHVGRDDQPARATSTRDLSGGADLSERSFIQLSLDGAPGMAINCAGSDPANTRPGEIVAAINAAFEATVARHDGRFITLNSPVTGPAGSIRFETPPAGDATEIIFGIGPRIFSGSPATAARIVGRPDLSAGLNLMARHRFSLAVDGGSAAEIDLRTGAADPTLVTLDELSAAINDALGKDIATHDGRHLILASPTIGAAGRLVVAPLEETRRRRFVSRAVITDEAAQSIFGFVAQEAQGVAATSARLVGKADLSRGVDLRQGRYLRLAIDDRPAIDIDCAGQRPRATLIGEVVDKINTALGMEVALHDGKHFSLVSPSVGAGSRILIAPPRATDALPKLLDIEAQTVRGQDGTRVSFTGTVDLSAGVDLPAQAAIKLGLDGAEAVTILLTEDEPAHKTLTQLVIAINLALGANLAGQDGNHLTITSAKTGAESRLVFASAGESDVTETIFGVGPRSYQGAGATPARIVGRPDLSGGVDLSVARLLKFSVDGGPSLEVDCAAQAGDPSAATLGQIVAAINAATDEPVASDDGAHLILTSPAKGFSSRLTLETHSGGDAGRALLGEVPPETLGEAPLPATISGEVDLLAPVDLAKRSLLRLAVDGRRPVDIDVAGASAADTFLDEIVAAVNAVFPGLAAATEDNRLRLTSPTGDTASHLALLPLRHLELLEYPLRAAEPLKVMAQHGDRWGVVNDGAADVLAEVQFSAARGVVGPTLVNVTLGWRIRLQTVLRAGETVRLWSEPGRGLQGVIVVADGEERSVPGAQMLVGPLGSQAQVPFRDTWLLTGNNAAPASLQLNNPRAQNLVRLRAKRRGPDGHAISVAVAQSQPEPDLAPGSPDGGDQRLVGRVWVDQAGARLVDAGETVIARLRAGPGVDLRVYNDWVVAVSGPLYAGEAGEPPLMAVETIARLFDVTVFFEPTGAEPVEERYLGVTIGIDSTAPDSLAWQINAGPRRSQLVTAEVLPKETILRLLRGRSEWVYLDCHGDRFNAAEFNEAHFAGGLCLEQGIFNASRFSNAPPESVAAVFALAQSPSNLATEIIFRYGRHRAGAFWVNLPADLPPRFGGRFNEARFGQRSDAPELYERAVTEPPGDPAYLIDLINQRSPLIEAAIVPFVPLGWETVSMPFRRPQFFTLGRGEEAARLYLSEEGVAGFIELKAREPGSWGNEIALSARQSGPAMYDVCVVYQGSPFENARQAVRGEPLPSLTQELLEPNPVGIWQAKAAGVWAEVSRDRAER